MNFSPYHNFRACDILEEVIREIIENDNANQISETGFYVYHFSLIHKLRSAKYHVQSLEDYLQRQDTIEENPLNVAYRVNFHFDGFTHVIGSSLDILAREILCYFGYQLQGNVYFRTAREHISNQNPNEPLLIRLQDPGWLQEFKDYRNTATHENVVGSQFTIINAIRGDSSQKRLLFPLPDDPRATHGNKSYNNNNDIIEYCATTFKRILRLINPIYSDLSERIEQNNSMPI